MSSIATADVPLQSVEDQDGFALDPDAPAQLDGNTPRAAPGVSFRSLKTESSDEHAILTPQVSVSPAASPEPPDGHPGIDSLMNNMHLSPSRPSARGQSHRHASVSGFGMHEVTQALDAVARQPDITRAQSVPVAGRGSKPPDAPHDVADEDPPDGLVHSHEFQRALTRAQMAMGNIERALSGSELDGDSQSTVYQLRSQASNLSRFQYPASRTVGFVGDSGVGKSSLLNSLLDKKDLARTVSWRLAPSSTRQTILTFFQGGSGAACTCVVTEYLYHPEETMDVVVDVFPSDELRQQIQYMVSQYRRFHRNEYETDEGPNAEIEAEFALLTLSSMFRSTLDDPSYLLDDDLDAILDQMVLWAEDNLEDEDLFATRRGLTTDECSSRIMQLSSEPPADSRPAAWPYIKKLRYVPQPLSYSTPT